MSQIGDRSAGVEVQEEDESEEDDSAVHA
jgi:hypothetical protein